MDCGCTVEGYQSDISRTFVFGEPTAEQRKVWNAGGEAASRSPSRPAQAGRGGGAASTTRRGATTTSLGYGPDYKLPGLSHRTGHGIGLDGHEPVNPRPGRDDQARAWACASSNEPGSTCPASSACVWRIACATTPTASMVLDLADVNRQTVRPVDFRRWSDGDRDQRGLARLEVDAGLGGGALTLGERRRQWRRRTRLAGGLRGRCRPWPRSPWGLRAD